MRSIRVALLLAATALVAVALAAPAVASASNWKQSGVALTGMEWTQEGSSMTKEGSLSFSGPFNVTGLTGSIKCQSSGSIALTPGESGQVNSFTVTPGSCTLGGLLGACKEVKSITANSLPWSATASGTAASPTISIKGFNLTYNVAGGECGTNQPVTYTGSLTATPDKGSAISTLSFSGTLKDSLGNGATPSGTVNASPAGKYGIGGKTSSVAIAGTLNWTGSLGSTNCKVNGSLSLEAGTSNGKVPSLTTSECSSGGALAAACGKSTGLTINSLPWTLVDEGTTIAVKGVSISIGTTTCGYGTYTGELKATPDKTGAISLTTLSGTLSNGGSTISWGGEWNWSPAGTYGL